MFYLNGSSYIIHVPVLGGINIRSFGEKNWTESIGQVWTEIFSCQNRYTVFFPKSYHCYIHNMENWNKVTYLICYMYSTPLCSICSFWEFIFWRLNSIKLSFRITHFVIFPIKKEIPLSTNMIFTNRRNFQNDALFKRLTFAIQFLNSLDIKLLLEIIIIYIYVL